jgi:TonB family protein
MKLKSAFFATFVFGLASCATPSPIMYKGRAFDQIVLRKSQVTGCYLAVPPPRNEGGFKAAFTVDQLGHVTSAKVVESTLHNPFVETCVLNILKSIPFEPPPSKEAVELQFPFNFKSD